MSGGRGTRHSLLFWRRPARIGNGGGGRYGFRIHAQKRRQSDPVKPSAGRARYPCGVCTADHQPDPDYLRQLSADVQSGYQPPESGPAGPYRVPSGGRSGGVRQTGDQRRGRILCLWPGIDERGLGVRLRHYQAQRPHSGHRSGRH